MDDPYTVAVISEQDSAEKVRAFLASPELTSAMKAAGILEMDQMYIMEEMDSGVH